MNVTHRVVPGSLRSVLAALAVALVVLVGLAGRAPSAVCKAARSGRAMTVVILAARDRPQLSSRAVQAVRSQFSDTPLKLRVVWIGRLAPRQADQVALARTHATKAGVLAVVWYDVSRPDKVFLVLAGAGRLVIRRVTGPAVGGRLEALAIIVRVSMLTVLAGHPIRSSPRIRPRPRPRPGLRPAPRLATRPRPRLRPAPRPAPRPRPRPAPPVRPAARSPWRFGLALEAGYAVSGFSTEVGALHGGAFAVGFHLRAGWELLLSYGVTQKVDAKVSDAQLSLQPHPLGVGARWRHRWGRFELGVSMALILDYATFDTSASPEALRASTDRGDLLVSAQPMISAAVVIAKRIRFFAAAGAMVGFNYRKYLFDDNGVERVILSPWPVQPVGTIGLSVDVF